MIEFFIMFRNVQLKKQGESQTLLDVAPSPPLVSWPNYAHIYKIHISEIIAMTFCIEHHNTILYIY